MLKKIILIFSLLLAIASFGGYFFLNEKITDGERQLAEGQQKYDRGAKMLRAGESRLSSGKKELSNAKTVYNVTAAPASLITDRIPVVDKLFSSADRKLKEGDQAIASGEKQVKEGRAKLAAGKIALEEGRKKLAMAKQIRTVCLYSGVFFGCLFILLLFWRRNK